MRGVVATASVWAWAASACLLACQPSSSRPGPHVPPAKQLRLNELIGTWRWLSHTDEAGTSRSEDEEWQLAPSTTTPMQLVGHYLRTVTVRSTDRVPFGCNQRTAYRQRAVYDVIADFDMAKQIFSVRETGYRAEPSPCDHGFRKIASYTGDVAGNRLVLHWQGGEQTLMKIADTTAAPSSRDAPWLAKVATVLGPWRWQATSLDDKGNIRDEDERWEITRRTDTRVDATYKRHVTVHSPDGSPIACANAPSWSFDDTYVLEGQREDEHWRFTELAVEPGDHACLRATPHRSLDEATAEQLGDGYLVLEWRGKRHEVLYRPD